MAFELENLITEGFVSLYTFLIGILPLIVELFCHGSTYFQLGVWPFLFLYVLIANIIVYYKFKLLYDIALRGLGLGLVMSFGIILSFSDTSFRLFGWYTASLAFFHWSEYFTTAYSNPKNLSLQSYLLDHSMEYHIAAGGSLCEFFLEWYFFPDLKSPNVVSVVGLILVIGGECLRKLSMCTAAKNFNHYVQYYKSKDHELVTSGVYRYVRHPAYVGWFYWSVGTQIMMCNPVCLIGYAYAAWRFFSSRIYEEELALISFFQEEYIEYQKKVPTGLPFIKGFEMNKQNMQ